MSLTNARMPSLKDKIEDAARSEREKEEEKIKRSKKPPRNKLKDSLSDE